MTQPEATLNLAAPLEQADRDRVLAPFGAQVAGLDTIPGINRRRAEVLIAEIGVDMSRFPSEHHLASWAGLCPGNNETRQSSVL